MYRRIFFFLSKNTYSSSTKSSLSVFNPRHFSSSSTTTTMIAAAATSSMNASSTDITSSDYYTIGITGSSGLLGTALIHQLVQDFVPQQQQQQQKLLRIVKFQRSTLKQVQEMSSLPTTSRIESTHHSSSSSSSSNSSSNNKSVFILSNIPWNPYGTGEKKEEGRGIHYYDDWCIHPKIISQLDVVIHLAGENVATSTFLPKPLQELGLHAWTRDKKEKILNSRVVPTQNLAKALFHHHAKEVSPLHQEQQEQCQKKNMTPLTFIVASGIGIYGYHYHEMNTSLAASSSTSYYHTINDEENSILVTQSSKGFLAQVSREWEKASLSGVEETKNTTNHTSSSSSSPPNIRIVQLRLAPILSTKGGALSKLLPFFKLGGGGILGSGKQYFSFISITDASRAIIHILQQQPSSSSSNNKTTTVGPVNIVSPIPCTNYEFTKMLGKILHRPTLLPMPSWFVQLLFGEMGKEMLLGGVVACPKKLIDSGFHFHHPTIEDALSHVLKEKR